MSISRCREIKEIGDKLFSDRMTLMTQWQEMADHFYPERADFTTTRTLGDEFASHLMTSFPVVARRTLADQFGAMLRPRGVVWAKLRAADDRINEEASAKQWLEHRSEIMRKAMYETQARFVRATKEGDHDFATFGQCVLEIRMRKELDGLLFRCYHLRDVAWCENAEGEIDAVHRKVKLTAKAICELFPETAPKDIKNSLDREPYKEFECRHVVVPADHYYSDKNKNRERFPFMSFYLLSEPEAILEELPSRRLGYVIPRWQTVSGSQYGFSPATVAALPDARLIQQMTLSLLEAGEKSVTPPMIATQEAVRTDIDLHAGGVTWVEREYDEKLGEALRPLTQDYRGLGHGLELTQNVREALKEDFFLNKITLPEIGPKMTAFEVQERIKEFVRSNLPIFEPMETEYNGGLCEQTFEVLLDHGAFGSPDDIPEVLRGAEMRFQFESPLQATADRAKLEAFNQALGIVGAASQVDPGVTDEINLRKAFREALGGAQVPADWLNDPEYVEQLGQSREKQRKQEMAAQMVERGAAVADQVGSAVSGLAAAAPA